MIVAGIALIASVFIAAIASTVWVMGWKLATGVWALTAVGTAAVVGGSWLIALGVTQ